MALAAEAEAGAAALEGRPVNVYKMKCFVGEPRNCYGNWVSSLLCYVSPRLWKEF